MVLWWATPVECAAALARIEKEDQIWKPVLQQSRLILSSLVANATEIHPGEDVRTSAEDLLSRHPLRAADSFQLAAALAWREGYPDGASFVSLDNRLRIAATLEGFWVFPAIDEVHDSAVAYGQHSMFSEISDRPIPD